MERIMKTIQGLVSAALAIAMVAPASAATTDPEVIIYRFPGVRDDGAGDNTGVATAFHCTNFSGVDELIRIVVRNVDGGIAANVTTVIPHLQTRTLSTHPTAAYIELALSTNAVSQGTAAIAATSINVICTAMTIDASTAVPVGVALRGIRFSPVPGSQE
jgi:hypothetical protein